MGIGYASREQVMRSLEILQASYSGSLIDAKIEWASRLIDNACHRRFYPERRTISHDWPNYRDQYTWSIDLPGINEMISLASVVSGGTNITSGCYLSNADDLDEPPYSTLQVDLSSASAFSTGVTFQRSLVITGLFGYNDTATDLAGGALSAGYNSSVQTINIAPSSGEFTPGIGSLLLVGTERMVVRGRQMIASGATISSDATDKQSVNVITSTGAAGFAAGETILVDGERMYVNEVAGNNILVRRSWDGTPLSPHTTGAAIYALRQFTVTRGALGSTAASHLNADPVYVHKFPVNEWCVAETVCALEQNAGAYARTVGTGSSSRDTVGAGLEDVRSNGYVSFGRKGRLAAI
jgi:hypothetical protein